MPAAGCSGTPLRKLGIRAGPTVLLADAPGGFTIPGLPDGLCLQDRPDPADPYDTALWFPADRADLTTRLAGLRTARPKKVSRIPTDLTGDVLREIALPTGPVDNKVCTVDETRSAPRLVIRKALRPA